MRWSESVTLQFVKLYLKHEILWNPDHLLYRSRKQREKAYAQISSEFKATTMKSLSVAEIKIKIRSLRTTYGQQVQKILQKSSPDNIYEPSLIWFYEMDQCLKNVSTFRHSSLPPQGTEEVDSSCQIWVDQSSDNITNDDVKPDPLNAQSDDNCDVTNDDWSDTKMDITQQATPRKKNKKKKIKDKNSDEEVSMDRNFITSTEDEFEIYGKYIATQLRQMDLEKALRVQLEIQSIISAARISKLNSV